MPLTVTLMDGILTDSASSTSTGSGHYRTTGTAGTPSTSPGSTGSRSHGQTSSTGAPHRPTHPPPGQKSTGTG